MLPPDIQIESVGRDVTYVLPRRPLGLLRWFGLPEVAFGVFFAYQAVQMVMEGKSHTAGPIDYIFPLFSIPFILGGLSIVFHGLLTMFGSCRVEWRDKRLSGVEVLGPLRWRRRLSRRNSSLRKLSVKCGRTDPHAQPVTSGPFASLGLLLAEYDKGRPRMVAIGYPNHWLDALARDLAARLAAWSGASSVPKVELVDAAKQPLDSEMVERPADSQLKIEPRPNGWNLTVPPAGLRRGTHGFFGFAILWCSFMVVFTAGWIFAATKKPTAEPWPVWIFIVAFWGIGLGMLLTAINLGRRRVEMRVDNGRLHFLQSGPFGAKQWEWPRDQIAAIRIGPSGLAVGDRPLLQLQIHPVGARKSGFFTAAAKTNCAGSPANSATACRLGRTSGESNPPRYEDAFHGGGALPP